MFFQLPVIFPVTTYIVIVVRLVNVHPFPIRGSRRQYTSPSIDKVNNAIPINRDVLPCYHLYCLLCHYPSKERSNVWKVSSWCANAMSLSALVGGEKTKVTSLRQHLRSPFRQDPYRGPGVTYARVARSRWAHRFA
jgi:hypothetical protein